MPLMSPFSAFPLLCTPFTAFNILLPLETCNLRILYISFFLFSKLSYVSWYLYAFRSRTSWFDITNDTTFALAISLLLFFFLLSYFSFCFLPRLYSFVPLRVRNFSLTRLCVVGINSRLFLLTHFRVSQNVRSQRCSQKEGRYSCTYQRVYSSVNPRVTRCIAARYHRKPSWNRGKNRKFSFE